MAETYTADLESCRDFPQEMVQFADYAKSGCVSPSDVARLINDEELMYRCLHGTAPKYLSELCFRSTSLNSSSRYCLRSACASSNQLVVPSVRLKTFGGRRFGVVGPAIWNSLPDYLKDPDISFDTFRKHVKTYLFAHY